ncbi:sperm flagellar protein 1 [Ammospiza maritima maritima]
MAPRRSPQATPPVAMAAGTLSCPVRWLDTVPLSRPRRNIARDFSDGVLAAEVVKFFFPSLVELHSFVPTSSTAQKVANWGHLNRKVLSKLNLRLPEEMIQALVRSQPGTAEQLLQLLRDKILQRQTKGKGGAGKPPAESAALDEGQIPGNRPAQVPEQFGRGCSQDSAPGEGWAVDGALLGTVTVAVPAPPGASPGGHATAAGGARAGRCSWRGDTIQILQAKVGRLEQLLLLKNLRIDDLSQRLQQLQGQRR